MVAQTRGDPLRIRADGNASQQADGNLRHEDIIDVEGRTGAGAIAPVERGMSFRALSEPVESVVGTNQTERGNLGQCVGVVACLAGLVSADVIVQIACHD